MARSNKIYKVTNKINGKIYIGQTWKDRVAHRISYHFSPSNKEDTKFTRAIKKYGKENFNWEVITELYTQLDADYAEIYLIRYYNSIKNGYNTMDGGRCSQHSDETKRKLSLLATGRISKKRKKVVQLDRKFNFISEYKSISIAAKCCNTSTSNISQVCKDSTKSCKGFKWMYTEDYFDMKNKPTDGVKID